MIDTKPLLAMRDVDKVFGNAAALTAASLEVMPAEVMAVVGQHVAKGSCIHSLKPQTRPRSDSVRF